MTPKERAALRRRHQLLHRHFDELIAAYFASPEMRKFAPLSKMPSNTTVAELMHWSAQQCGYAPEANSPIEEQNEKALASLAAFTSAVRSFKMKHSQCCNAELRVTGDAREGTMYHVCSACGHASDPKSASFAENALLEAFTKEQIENQELLMEFALSPHAVSTIIGQLQLALRHPRNDGPAANLAREFVAGLINVLRLNNLTVSAQVAELGNEPANDVPC